MHKVDIYICVSNLWKLLKESFPKFLLHIKAQSHSGVFRGFVQLDSASPGFAGGGGGRQMQTVKSHPWKG